jgi:hypothetical protein
MKCLLRVAHLKGFTRKEGDECTEEWISERKQKVDQLPSEVAFPAGKGRVTFCVGCCPVPSSS